MKNAIRNVLLLTACVWNLSAFALDDRSAARLGEIQQDWASINYGVAHDQRATAFERLDVAARAALAETPEAPELLIWHGIILASRAREQGGTDGLELAEQARARLETALQLDPSALGGAGYTNLGALYYQVPAWPEAFRDDERAEALLKTALEINPDGVDANYFYGDFLYRQKRYDESHAALLCAVAVSSRTGGCETADEGRRAEARALLAKVAEHLY